MDVMAIMDILEEAIDSMEHHREAQCRLNALRVTRRPPMHAGICLLWSLDHLLWSQDHLLWSQDLVVSN